MTISEQIQYGLSLFPKNTILNTRKIYDQYFSEIATLSNYLKIMSRMIHKNKIIQLGKGVFYIPEMTDSGNIKPLNGEDYKTFVIKNHSDGFEIGEGLYYSLRLTGKKPLIYKFYTNTISQNRISIRNVTYYKIPFSLDSTIVMFIQFMDILSSYKNISNLNLSRFQNIISEFILVYSDSLFLQIDTYFQYPKHVIAFLVNILDSNNVSHSLLDRLSTNSKYHIPNWNV
jgi:hypothetical protein